MLRLPSEGLPLGADLFSDLDLSVPDWLPSAPKQFQVPDLECYTDGGHAYADGTCS